MGSTWWAGSRPAASSSSLASSRGSWPRWRPSVPELADAIRANLGALRRDLGASPPEEVRDARDVEAVAGLFGPTRGRQNAAMARAISGRPGPASADYRAAIRNVQRYRTGARQRRGL